MGIAEADETFPAVPSHLKGIVRNHVYFLDKLDVFRPPDDLRVDLGEIVTEKFLTILFVFLEFRRRYHYSETHNFIIHRDEPSPVVFLLVKDKGVVLGHFPRGS